MFFSSGGAVYGAPGQGPVSETYKGWPVSPYGVAKLSMEHYLHMFSVINDLPYQIVRPSNPYGPRQNYRSTQGVISIFMHRIANGLPVTVWGDGVSRKDYVYVGDLARAVCLLLDSKAENEMFNIGSGIGLSLNELIRMIEEICCEQAHVTYQPERLQDVKEIVLSCERIGKAVGWIPSVDIEQGLLRTYEWMSACQAAKN